MKTPPGVITNLGPEYSVPYTPYYHIPPHHQTPHTHSHINAEVCESIYTSQRYIPRPATQIPLMSLAEIAPRLRQPPHGNNFSPSPPLHTSLNSHLTPSLHVHTDLIDRDRDLRARLLISCRFLISPNLKPNLSRHPKIPPYPILKPPRPTQHTF